MTKLILWSTLVCWGLAGCNQASSPAPPKTFVWEKEERPYKVLGVGQSNAPRIGDQTRSAQVVYSSPERRKKVAEALKEIYTELKEDIETIQPDAKYRRINIKIYDTDGDAKHDPDAWLCFLQFAPEAGAKLPEWPSEAVAWQWRDPALRPAERSRKIEWEYLDALGEINRSVQFPVTEAELTGKKAAEKRTFMEQRYRAESQELKRQLASKYKMPVDELERLLKRVLVWKYGARDGKPE